MRARRAIVGLLVVAAVLSVASPGSADLAEPSGDRTGDGALVTVQGVQGVLVGSPGVPGWVSECEWEVLTTAEVEAEISWDGGAPNSATILRGGEALDDPKQKWSWVYCPLGVSEGGLVGGVYIWPVDSEPPQAVQDWLVAWGQGLVRVPSQVGWGAPFGDEGAPMITQFPTWLWVEPEVWVPVSATTPAVFGMEATVTATPVRVVFEGAEGEWVDCGANLGPVYDFSRSEEDQDSFCTLTWHHSSAVGEWSLTSFVTWEFRWVCSRWCGSGTLEPLTVVVERPVVVAELQAVLKATPEHLLPES